jgi:hypothetical protein
MGTTFSYVVKGNHKHNSFTNGQLRLKLFHQIDPRDESADSFGPVQKEQLIDMIAGVQSHRMNEQRASAAFLPGTFFDQSILLFTF